MMDIGTVCIHCGEPLQCSVSGRQCVACLLELVASPESFDIDAQDDAGGQESPFLSNGVLPRFKDYVLHEEIARGGMGVVYRAQQISLKRPVAIKLILAGQLATTASVQRFLTEAEAAAKLDHPGIVPIYEVGQHETQHFFSMKLIDGANLAQRMSEFALTNSMSPQEARDQQKQIANLIARVARALAFAHERRVLHRDVKPGNILIDCDGNPYLIDFGLAKLTGHDASGLTLSAAILGSPSYMAPEQALGDVNNVTTLADVYGLGAVLYELLTGQPPFLGSTALATMRQLTDTPPKRPSRLNARVHRDLETVALKCLEKKPEQRYAGAAQVAEELERFVRNEPITARRVGSIESLWRWSRRHRVIAGFSAALLLALVVGFAAVTWQWRRAELTNVRLEESIDRSLWSDIIGMVDRYENSEALAHLAARLRSDPNDWRSAMLATSILDHRHFASPAFPAVSHGDAFEIAHVTFSPNGKRFATAAADGTARIWDSTSGRLIARLPHDAAVTWVDFSPDGRTVVTASRDHTAKRWNVESGQLLSSFPHDDVVNMAVHDTSGDWIATASDDRNVRLWNAPSQKFAAAFDCAAAVVSVDIGPDDRLLTASIDGTIRIFDIDDLSTPTLAHSLPTRGKTERALFSHDGRFVVSTSANNEIGWQIDNQRTVFDVGRQPSCYSALAMNKNHALLPIGGRITQVMDLETGNMVSDKFRPKYQTFANSFDHLGRRIATGGWDYAVQIIDYQTSIPDVSPIQLPAVPQQLQFSPDDQSLLIRTGSLQFVTNSPSEQASVFLWRLNKPAQANTFKPTQGRTNVGAINHRNDRFAVGTGEGVVILDRDLQVLRRLGKAGGLRSIAFTPDGQRVVICQTNGTFSVWDVQSGERMVGPADTGGECYCYRLSPDGRLLAVASDDGFVSLWNTETGEQNGQQIEHGGTLNDVTFSPDGKLIATASDNHTAKIWSVDSLRCVQTFRHRFRVQAAKFSPDGSKLVTAANDFTAQIWDIPSGRPIGATMRHQGEVSNAEFSPDGTKVLTSARDGTARIWDARSGAPLVPMMIHDSALREANFSPNSRLAVTIDHDALRVWDVETGLPVGVKVLQKSGQGIGHDSMGERAPFTSDSASVLWSMVVPETQLCSTEIPPTPVPTWFPEMLEAIGGQELDSSNSPVRVSIDDALSTRKIWSQRPPSGPDFFQDRLRSWLSGTSPTTAE
jgi:WD40 repeat protein/serine/threonine protein kinase